MNILYVCILWCFNFSAALGAFQDRMLRYMASMDRRMQSMQSDMRRLNQKAWGEEPPRKTMKTQIPCESIDQLRIVEEEITDSAAAYKDLVSQNIIKIQM